MTDEDSSEASSSSKDVVGIAISPISNAPPPPSPTPSSSASPSQPTCLMAKGSKHKTFDDSSSEEEDDDAPSYKELATLVRDQNHLITKQSDKVEKLKSEKKELLNKCNKSQAG